MSTSHKPRISKEELLQAQLVVATAKKEKKAKGPACKTQGKRKPKAEAGDENQPPTDTINRTRTIYVE